MVKKKKLQYFCETHSWFLLIYNSRASLHVMESLHINGKKAIQNKQTKTNKQKNKKKRKRKKKGTPTSGKHVKY